MYNYHFKRVSSNSKTGPIPVTTTSKNSCPDLCGMREACYADYGPLRMHWDKVTDGSRGVSLKELCADIRSLPKGQLWRHNQAGDLPHDDGELRHDDIKELVSSNRGKRGFTYSHHALTLHNEMIMYGATLEGFTINASTDTVTDAVRVFKTSALPVVTVLPMDAPNVQKVDGVKIVACPAEKTDRVQCANCALCYVKDRTYVIGFRAHGTKKKQADIIAKG